MQTAPDQWTFPLDKSTILIGRDAACALALNAVGISRRHAAIRLDPAYCTLTDLQSSFGTRLNGEPVDRADLYDGATVALGVVVLTVALSEREITLKRSSPTIDPSGDAIDTSGAKKMRIGRDSACEIYLPHPQVSRFHAELDKLPDGSLTLSDRGSTNGTFVNGKAVRSSVLADGDCIQAGPYRFYLEQGRLIAGEGGRGIRVEAFHVSARVGARKYLLHDVSLSIAPGEFVAILGPSGSGKTTLSHLLCGMQPVSGGVVYINGLPLRSFYAAFRSALGFVSQQNVVPGELTVAELFSEQARLRLPGDSRPAERANRIAEVRGFLKLDSLAGARISRLSGGEAKRVHLGIELLAAPALIILDEPFAGLDPGLIAHFMRIFRALADRGHTVALTTHTLEQIDRCDKIIFLRGGRLVSSGAPGAIGDHFSVRSLAEVYEGMELPPLTIPDLQRGDAPDAAGALAKA
ncbi:MAG: FHA domain-containing protein, partial [Chitinivibrionales bacterium]|nr:FHA domain-containing protein [Chitinivibrionales bacterium]